MKRWKGPAIFALAALLAGCGGGGRTAPPVVPDTPEDALFLQMLAPAYDGVIVENRSFTIAGTTRSSATVVVNGQGVNVDSNGGFSLAISISGKQLDVTVTASEKGETLTAAATVYYRVHGKCAVVFVAEDSSTGVEKIFDEDPDIPGSRRVVSSSDPAYRAADPALSPNGAKVAYVNVGVSNGSTKIVEANCDGLGQETTRATTSVAGARFRNPAWAPDGANLAWSANTDDLDNFDIYYTSGGSVVRFGGHAADDDSPAWSPDGLELAFHSNRAADGGAGLESRYWLWSAQIAGGASSRFPFQALCATGSVCSSKRPDWSPDGSAIVFQYESACPAPDPESTTTCTDIATELYMIDPNDDGAAQHLTSGGNSYRNPKWSLGGSKIIFEDLAAPDDLKMISPSQSPSTVQSTGLSGFRPDW